MNWGDEFQRLVPGWIPQPKQCSCKDMRRKMNQLDADSAASLFDSFHAAIVDNAKKSILRPIPARLLESAIRRRMKNAYKQAFGIDLD